MEELKKEKKFNYTWIIISLCFLMVFTALGFCSSPKSLFIKPVTEYLGIERSVFSINDSCRFIATAVVNVFFGYLINKFGSKKLICAGFLCLVASMLIYAFAENVVLFYVGGCLLGVGLSWTTTTMVGYVVNRWCANNKGTIMGLVLASNGLGGALAMQILTPIINRTGEIPGFKVAYIVVASILLVVGILVTIFYRDNKEATAPAAKKKARGQSWVGIEYSKAVKKTYFYLALVCIFLTGLVLQSINGISAAHMGDVGLDAGFVATVMSIASISLAVFKFAVGFIYDKFGLRVTVIVCALAGCIVSLLLAFLTNTVTGKIFAVLYGVLSALALPLETIMLPIFANDLFGEKSFNKVLGLFVSVNTAGYALGTPLINLCFDIFGSYKYALILFAGVMFIVLIVLQFIITMAHHERKLIQQTELEMVKGN